MLEPLTEILNRQNLYTVFQPIVDIHNATIIGYEGLTRGPDTSTLHAPADLFQAALRHGLSHELERLCVLKAIESFVKLELPGKLFLNLSPAGLTDGLLGEECILELLRHVRLTRNRVIIEITESEPTCNFSPLIEAAARHREVGFEMAMDDLGEGFSSLRLWSELRPQFVKVDKHFIRNIHQDSVKLQFVRSIQQIAENCGSRVVAEGIETLPELMVVKDLGIAFGQGYFLGRPDVKPESTMGSELVQTLSRRVISVYPQTRPLSPGKITAVKIAVNAPHVSPKTRSETVLNLLLSQPDMHAVPVVENRVPVGIINRTSIVDSFSRVYTRELYGRRPCSLFMDPDPLIVDRDTPLEELSRLVVDKGKTSFSDGFILTYDNEYFGIGNGYDLMREISAMQIHAARYANPLTLLPGNVPIAEHTERLLKSKAPFAVCHCDLDHFKPFNDMYGYRKGDEVIQGCAQILVDCCDSDRDFVGHVGGDDFIILFQSTDWQERCRRMLTRFDEMAALLFKPEHIVQSGYFGEDRRGNRVFFPLLALSIGAVSVELDAFSNAHELAAVAAEAKKMAKRTEGSNLFIERRNRYPVTADLFPDLNETNALM